MPDFNKRQILIVDDDSIMREILKGMLRTAGHTIVGEAGNGEQVADVLEKVAPEVICLDIHMPKMDGMQCLELLKASHPNIVVIMISSEATLQVVQGALAKGASGFIVKPFNAAKVLDTIQRSCAKKAARTICPVFARIREYRRAVAPASLPATSAGSSRCVVGLRCANLTYKALVFHTVSPCLCGELLLTAAFG